jgi:erythronate-4-phosphate dehydrogenase
LYKIKELIPTGCKLSLYNPSDGLPDIAATEALLIRTVTTLNAETLPSPPKQLTFIGTGSSGMDHLDNDYLEDQGIKLASANGCNARTVAEYVVTAMLLWKEKHQPKKPFGKVGVIGVGKAGSAVTALLADFGIEFEAYDPPREQRDADFKSASLQEVMDCDILTFHVPLNKKGPHPTFHWLDEKKLHGKSYELVINAARGGVIDEMALMKYYVEGSVHNYVLDVWEGEPDFNTEVAKHAFIATPHIAGYSEQAKVNATKMICNKLAAYFELGSGSVQYEIPDRSEDLAHIQYDLTKLITRLHPILGYDQALRDLTHRPDRIILFRNLRNEWPYRLEYPSIKIRQDLLDTFPELINLGIQPLS